MSRLNEKILRRERYKNGSPKYAVIVRRTLTDGCLIIRMVFIGLDLTHPRCLGLFVRHGPGRDPTLLLQGFRLLTERQSYTPPFLPSLPPPPPSQVPGHPSRPSPSTERLYECLFSLQIRRNTIWCARSKYRLVKFP